MKPKEIEELMLLKDWSQAELARALEVNRSAISRWIKGEQNPTGPARVLLREWLEEARKQPA
jgi:transcriptional regulator with XRE-family HTH domain